MRRSWYARHLHEDHRAGARAGLPCRAFLAHDRRRDARVQRYICATLESHLASQAPFSRIHLASPGWIGTSSHDDATPRFWKSTMSLAICVNVGSTLASSPAFFSMIVSIL